MTLDLATLAELVAVSGGVAVAVESVKTLIRTFTLPDESLERIYLRGLGLLLGVALVGIGWGWGVVEVCVGMLAGAASEVVYRWLIAELPALLERLRPG
jgi:hypothetical protein